MQRLAEQRLQRVSVRRGTEVREVKVTSAGGHVVEGERGTGDEVRRPDGDPQHEQARRTIGGEQLLHYVVPLCGGHAEQNLRC
jgi:hypothetical protein